METRITPSTSSDSTAKLNSRVFAPHTFDKHGDPTRENKNFEFYLIKKDEDESGKENSTWNKELEEVKKNPQNILIKEIGTDIFLRIKSNIAN